MARTKLSNDSVGSDQLAHDLALQGNPTGTTQSSGNNTTRLATTAFVTSAVAGGGGGGVAGISSNADATAITIDSSENVGIGETSPSFRLHVKETPGNGAYSTTTNMDPTTRFHASEATTGSYTAIQLGANNGNSALGWWNIGSVSTSTNYDNDLVFQTRTGASSYAERMRINNSGNLGIGTTSPDSNVHIAGSAAASLRLERNDTTISSGNTIGNIHFEHQESGNAGICATLSVKAGNNDGNGEFVFENGVGGTVTEKMRIKSSGNVSIADGNLSFADGHGIDFSAKTYDAGGDPNHADGGSMANELLDDYEEGTWTPAYGVSTGSFTTLTHSVQSGYYTKVGDVCTAVGRLDTTAMSIGSASNYLFITGFPFPSKTGAYQSGVIGYSYGYSTVWANAVAFQGSTAYAYLFSVDDGANSNTIGTSNLGTGQTYLYFSITYITN